MTHFTPKHLFFKISEAKKIEGKQCCAYGCKNKPNPRKSGESLTPCMTDT